MPMCAGSRFQFHLSTAILSMPIASMLIWLNIGVRVGKPFITEGNNASWVRLRDDVQGWPRDAIWKQYQYKRPDSVEAYLVPGGLFVSYSRLATNVIAGLAIIIAAGVALECPIRRFARKATDT